MHWKIKGIAAKLTYRLFLKYGGGSRTGKSAPTDFNQAFSLNFVESLIPPLLDSHLQIVFKKKTHFVGSIALNYALQFLCIATKIPLTMSIMEPYIENILFETTVPIILVTTNDVYLFKEEPIEYIRK